MAGAGFASVIRAPRLVAGKVSTRQQCVVSVIMPVFNGSAFLKQAIDSILNQSFRNFEFIILDDGSTDDSVHIVKSYKDNRICLIENGRNLGVIRTLNRGLELAQGKYIARMDADDLSLEHRLERQIEFLDAHPNIVLCGTWATSVGAKRGLLSYPTDHVDILFNLLFYNSFAHPSVMFRSSWIRQEGMRYSSSASHAEDFDFWTRIVTKGEVANIPEILLKYRVHDSNISIMNWDEGQEAVRSAREKLIDWLAGGNEATALVLRDCFLRVRETSGLRCLAKRRSCLRIVVDALSKRYPGKARREMRSCLASRYASALAETLAGDDSIGKLRARQWHLATLDLCHTAFKGLSRVASGR